MVTKSLIVVNPVSGKIDKTNIDFSKYFLNCKIINWEFPDTDISKVVKEELQKEKYNNIIVAGGDGTVNKVAQIIVNTNYTLGIIPLGSGNGLARHLGIPMNVEKSIKIILGGNNKKIDACKINDIFFFCTSGVGFDAHIGNLFATSKTRGFKTYLKITLNQFLKYKDQEYELLFDGKSITNNAFLVTFANANQYGNNTFIAPLADISDGKIDVTIIKPFKFYNAPCIAYRVFNKTIHKSNHTCTFQASEFILKRKAKGIAHFDGEPCFLPEEIYVKNLPSALNVFVK
jgi:diacylglycerol kinase (ATP)